MVKRVNTILNYSKGNGDALERVNYWGLKLTDQILEIAVRVAQKLIGQQVNIYEMSLGFISGCETKNAIFDLWHSWEKH